MSKPRRPRYRPHALGDWGERYTADRLRLEGWTVLEQGYRLGRREIDLIVRRGGLLAFVEVKTRSDATYGPPEEAVTHRKRTEIEAVARDYLMRLRVGDVDVRFDVVAIVAGPGRAVLRYEHIEDAWRPREPGF